MFWDIATVSGVTYHAPSGGDVPMCATVTSRHSDDDLGQAYDALDRACTDMIAVHRPDVLAFEAAFPFQGRGASPIPTNFGTVRKILGMVAIVEKCGWRAGLDVYECNIGAIRKHFTGNGRADKAEVFHRCKVLGWPVKNLDEADSAAGWDFTNSMLRAQAARGDA